MAWSTSDWGKSGITDTYRFMMCDNRSRKEVAELTGVRSATLSANYYGDIRLSGTVDVSGSNFVTNRLIRVYHKATLGERSIERCLGTFYTNNDETSYLHGRSEGTIVLSGMLLRLSQATLPTPFTFAAKGSALNSFWQLLQAVGAKADGRVSNVPDKAWGDKGETIDFGETYLKALNRVASHLGAQIWSGTDGTIQLIPYVAPANRPRSFTCKTGEEGVVFEGVDVAVNRADVVNRCTVRFEKSEEKTVNGKKTTVKVPIYGVARLDESSSFSFEKTGRFVDEHYEVQALNPATPERANEVAKQKLNSFSRGGVDYTFRSWALPFGIGDVVRLQYKDHPTAGGIDVDGMVTNQELDLSPTGLRMETTIRRVRVNG